MSSIIFKYCFFFGKKGSLKANIGENPMVWFRLHPLKADNSGWWYYKATSMEDAIHQAIHRGRLGIDKEFEVMEIRAKKGKHEHGV